MLLFNYKFKSFNSHRNKVFTVAFLFPFVYENTNIIDFTEYARPQCSLNEHSLDAP